MRVRYLLFAVFMVLLQPLRASAQRIDYQGVYDSVAQVRDMALLRRMERDAASGGAAASLQSLARRGIIALRLYALSQDRADGRRAREVLERAVERYPNDPWSHYLLAQAWARGPDARLPLVGGIVPQVTLGQTVAEIFGRDATSRARRSAQRALEVEASFGPAAVLLAELAIADGRDRDDLRAARTALIGARDAGDRSAAVARALSDIETSLGNYSAAAAAADAGGENASAMRSRGIALLLQDGREAEGYTLYRRAIDRADLAAATLFYQDVGVLVNPQEAAEWKAAEGAPAKQAWLQRFWDRRAAESGVTPAQRVAEHYRRLGIARERYVRTSRRGSDSQTGGTLLSEQPPVDHIFDDRGVVFIRHGAPQQAVRTAAGGVLPNESWSYLFPGREDVQLFHFVALRGAQDYSLVGDILQALDPSIIEQEKVLRSLEGRLDNYRGPDLARRENAVMSLIQDRAAIDPRYRNGIGRLREALRTGQPLDGTEIRSIIERADVQTRQGARVALRTDSYVPAWKGEIAFHHDIFTFRTPAARTAVTAAFALPATHLTPIAGSGGSGYAVRLSLILTDTLQDVVTRLDTIMPIQVAGPLGANDYVRTHITMPVVPSEHTLFRLVAEDVIGERGALESGAVRLHDYSGNRLQISDVVLARPDSVGDWRRGDVELALVLPRRFGPQNPFTVFYEVYNLAEETPYATEITVEPTERGSVLGRIFGGGPDRLRLRFDGVAAPTRDGVVQEVRQLASELKPGTYRLEINVTNRTTGESAGTSTVFTVLSR